MIVMEKYTTIQIRRETRERLKTLRITRRETYDEIINRLIEKCGKSSLTTNLGFTQRKREGGSV